MLVFATQAAWRIAVHAFEASRCSIVKRERGFASSPFSSPVCLHVEEFCSNKFICVHENRWYILFVNSYMFAKREQEDEHA